jgi:hypothetical protein
MWSALAVSGMITGALLLVYVILARWVADRRRLDWRLAHLERQAVSHEAIKAALRHFRHDLNNLLFSMSAANRVARVTLEENQPDQASRALDVVEDQLRQSLDFVDRFHPGGEQELASPIDLRQVVLLLVRPLAIPTSEVIVARDLSGWVVEAPPVTFAVLLGNLIKNALEASQCVRVLRRGTALCLENPVRRAELPALLGEDIYVAGFSTKGPGRGIGLESARRAAAHCRVTLDHEIFQERGKPWVRFRVDFGEAAAFEPTPESDRPIPHTSTLGDWPPPAPLPEKTPKS